MTIPNDTARCPGVSFTEDGVQEWREGCEDCLRRTSHGGCGTEAHPLYD